MNDSWPNRSDQPPPFRDRMHAGRVLAEQVVTHLKDDKKEAPAQAVVLALPRGGVVVGQQIADAINAPLDVLLVRKIGAPRQPELAIGAVVDTQPVPQAVWNEHLLQTVILPDDYQQQELHRQIDLIRQQRSSYDRALAGHPRPDIMGKTAIIVDDGIATGASIRAAIRGLRAAGTVRSTILCVPVAPAEVVADLRLEVDHVICPFCPAHLRAVSLGYENFEQTTEAEVIACLTQQRRAQDGRH
ncbi:MAG: phosphoribosyltransferase [Planctomycetes bacterium]|nr:phosphoribosyltransferase [Planctomycetota bacterium]NOG55688.1 phosphoribosyltransferase [Planctomycetota bacterium]